MRSLDSVFAALSGSAFRRKFRLVQYESDYLQAKQAHVVAAIERWLRMQMATEEISSAKG